MRHNAVGWPLTAEVNAFSMSLIIYPIIITGLVLVPSRPGRARHSGRWSHDAMKKRVARS
jgi:hypothetical protein